MEPELDEIVSKEKVVYRIAGLQVELVFPKGLKTEIILPSFEIFKVKERTHQDTSCTVELLFYPLPEDEDGGKLLSDISIEWADRFRFFEQENSYITTIWNDHQDGIWKMKSNKDFSHSVIYLLHQEQAVSNALSWLIMVAFGQTCLLHQTILIHASVIDCAGKGYAFLGKSGTGKSTHSRLWLQAIADTQLLNDDNPAIRIESNGKVFIYGTPWSGKTACFRNYKIPLEAFVRLRQAKYNRLSFKRWTAAFVSVLPSCTGIRWNKKLFSKMNSTLEAVLGNVLVAELDCLPNPEAAVLCHREIVHRKDRDLNPGKLNKQQYQTELTKS